MDRNDSPNPTRIEFITYAAAGANKAVLVASGVALVLGSLLASLFAR